MDFVKQKTAGIYAILLFIVSPVLMNAQELDTIKTNLPQNNYIERMDQYLAIKLSLNNDVKGFKVNNTGNIGSFEIKANDQNVLKLGINYRWLSFSISATPKFIPGNNDNTLKGNTKASSYAFAFNFDHWNQALSYTRVKGYYLNNTGDYNPGWVKDVDPFVQFPDLVYTSYYGHTAYKFNKNFSFNAVSAQTERQLKSAGTFMPVLSYNYYIIDDQTALTGQNSSQKQNNLEALLSLGYFYTYAMQKKLYISAGAVAGAGFIATKLLTRMPAQQITTHTTNPLFRFEGFLGVGYNAKRFFAGTQFVSSRVSYNQQKSSNVVVSNRLTYQIFAGYRFGAPKKVKEVMDKAEKAVPIL